MDHPVVLTALEEQNHTQVMPLDQICQMKSFQA
jgi:hypothetical protein